MDRLQDGSKQVSLFDVSDISDAEFFVQTERHVIDALRTYSESSHNGQRMQRQLFAEDSVRGFSFVDVCHQRFDVILMNPPFGEPTDKVRDYILTHLPDGRNDIYAAMIVRAQGMLHDFGASIGAITSRAFLL